VVHPGGGGGEGEEASSFLWGASCYLRKCGSHRLLPMFSTLYMGTLCQF
jgi:hypothetical protein